MTKPKGKARKVAVITPPSPPVEPAAAEEGLYSISRLAEYFDVDRATMRKRLDESGVKAVSEKAKEKLFRFEEAEAAMLEAGDDPLLDEAKRRKLTAEAKLKEIQVKREEEDLLPRREVEDLVQKLFTAMFQRVAVRMPRELAPQLAKAENTAQMIAILQTSVEKIFNDLRTNHQSLFSRD